MDKNEKQKIVAEIREKLDKASSIYLTDFSGLTVAQTNELRDELFNAKVDYKVLKNTLVKKALEGNDNKFSSQLDILSGHLKGQTDVIFAYEDHVTSET